MSKPCTKCGSPLPDAACFCPRCATQQQERELVMPPRPRHKKIMLATTVAIVLAALLFLFYQAEPRHIEGVGQVVYQDGKDIYQLTICINPGAAEQPWAASPQVTTTLDPNDSFRYPAQLLIYRNGYDPAIQEAFLSQMASCTVSATPLNGGTAMECTLPAPTKDFPDAALVSHITYYATSLRNQITWNFLMRNGDTITLTHIIEARPLETLHLYPEDVHMNDSEQLDALLDTLYREIDPSVIVYLHLPPKTYDKPVVLERRTFHFIGSSDGNAQTTFSGGVTVNTKAPSMACFENICFNGDDGYGLEAHYGVAVKGCGFSGWDIALYAGEGGSAGIDGCVFTDNQIGVKYDTGSYSYFRGDVNGCVFEDNGIAFWTARLPGNNTLLFPQTIFRNNGVDIQNDSGHELDLSETIFE